MRTRIGWGLAVIVAGAYALAAPVNPEPKKKGPADEFHFLAFDGFDGKLGLNWQPIRHDPSHVSLTKHPGKLTITTQRGTIHEAEKARNEPQAKNLFVIDNPLGKDVDFVMTTCITSFTPQQAYQQAGLLVYDDDDNYLKWSYEYNWRKGEGQTFHVVAETNAKAEHIQVDSESGLERYWLRLTKRGNRYEFASSKDGKAYSVYGQVKWGEGAPKKLGLIAKNGGPQGVKEMDVPFDFFELRSPAPAPVLARPVAKPVAD